jgi:hypothetical protein
MIFSVSKVLKHTAVFSLWLACLVILAHLFVPHDHHSDSFFTETEGSCTSHKAESRSGLPTHCHAFNDLAFDKGRPSVVINSDLPTSDLHPFEVINSATNLLSGSTFRYSIFRNSYISTDSPELSQLRGPPSLV